jgi:hypothetical protein
MSCVLNHLGRHAFSRMGKLKLSQYLADLEEKYGLVLYVADSDTLVQVFCRIFGLGPQVGLDIEVILDDFLHLVVTDNWGEIWSGCPGL